MLNFQHFKIILCHTEKNAKVFVRTMNMAFLVLEDKTDSVFHNMCLPGIYKLALTHKKLGITKELMATKIIPFLMPLSIENGLTLNQFNALMTVIKEMVSRVEGEHRTKLEQLNSIQQESKYVEL